LALQYVYFGYRFWVNYFLELINVPVNLCQDDCVFTYVLLINEKISLLSDCAGATILGRISVSNCMLWNPVSLFALLSPETHGHAGECLILFVG
jgi:hypothetical protein